MELDVNGSATITATDIDNGSTDNCTESDNLTLSLDISSFDSSNVGSNTVTLTVTDESGNTSSATAIVTVQENQDSDTTNPTVIVQDITVSLDTNGTASITPADVDSGSFDDTTADADLTFALDETAFDCEDLGSNTVTLTVTDLSGNTASATATVTIVDDMDPTVVTQDIVVSIDDLADSIEAIGKPKDTREQKIAQRLAYEEWQQSQRLAS